MSHVIRKKRHVASCRHPVCRNCWIGHFLKEAAMNKAQFVSCTWSACQVSFKRVFHATVLEAVLGSASSCWKWCCPWRKSWIARKYPCFIFDIPVWQGEFQKKKHVAPWRPVLHLPSLLPGTSKPSHKSDSINGSDPLCIWLASWWTTYSESGTAQALPLKSDVSWGHRCKLHALQATPPASLSLAKAFVGGKWTGSYGWQMPNGFIRCSPLNMEWSSRKQPPFETGKLCFEQKQFRVSLYKHEAASTWNKISVKVLGGRHRRRVLSASLFTSLRKQANWFQSPATHRIFRFRSCFPKQCLHKIPSVLNEWNMKQI